MDVYFSPSCIIVEEEIEDLNYVFSIDQSGLFETGFFGLDLHVYSGVVFKEA